MKEKKFLKFEESTNEPNKIKVLNKKGEYLGYLTEYIRWRSTSILTSGINTIGLDKKLIFSKSCLQEIINGITHIEENNKT